MKRLTLLSGLLVCLQSAAVLAQAPPEPPPVDPFVRTPGGSAATARGELAASYFLLSVETFALSFADAFSLLQNTNSAQRYPRAMELYQAGKARLVNVVAGSGRSGEQSVVSSTDEFRYPVEFNPPGPTEKIMGTAFETRNLGEGMEFTFSPSQERNIEVSVTRTFFRGFREIGWPIGDPTIPQPDFLSQQLHGTAWLGAGKVTLLGTMNPPAYPEGADKVEDEVWLVFGRVSRREPTQIQPAAQGQAPYGGLIQYSIFSLERPIAQELLKSGEPGEQGMAALMRLVGEKKARLDHLVTLPAFPGKRAKSFGAHELRFGSEWSPPTTELKVLKATEKRIVTSSENPPGQTRGPGSSSTTTEYQKEILPNVGDRIPGYPSSFETVNLQAFFEHEVIGNGQSKTLEVRFSVSDRRYLGDVKYPESLSTTPPSPLFEYLSCDGTIPVVANTPLLVGTLNPPGETGANGRKDNGQVRIIFARFIPVEP